MVETTMRATLARWIEAGVHGARGAYAAGAYRRKFVHGPRIMETTRGVNALKLVLCKVAIDECMPSAVTLMAWCGNLCHA